MKMNRFCSMLLVLAMVVTLLVGCGGGNKLTVDFDWNYITDNAPPAAIEVSGTYGSLPEVAENARPGFTFEGWYLNAAGNGEKITAGTQVTAEANHTLFAKWTGHKYTVSFDLQGGTINGVSGVDDATVTCGNVYSMMAIPDDPDKSGFQFGGWYYDAEGTQGPVDAASVVTKAEDHTLYAKWVEIVEDFDFESDSHLNYFDTRSNGFELAIVEKDGSKQLQVTNPTKGKPENFVVLRSTLKAGTKVSLDVTFEGELPEGCQMNVFCYGANAAGDPITTGTVDITASEANRKWYHGNGIRAQIKNGKWMLGDANWSSGNTATIEFEMMEDNYGIAISLCFGNGASAEQWNQTKIYLDNIHLIIPEEGV